MAALGLILVVIAIVLFLIGLLTGTSNGNVTYDLGPFDVQASPTFVFATGAVAMLVLFLGLWLLKHAGRKAREQRHERKRVEKLSRELDEVRRDDHKSDSGEDRPTPI